MGVWLKEPESSTKPRTKPAASSLGIFSSFDSSSKASSSRKKFVNVGLGGFSHIGSALVKLSSERNETKRVSHERFNLESHRSLEPFQLDSL